jgi:hypothetical protein
VWAQCPEKGDISNWFEAGLKTGDLWQIVEQLPDWSPELTAPPSKRPTPYNAPDPASIPRRAWLHDGHYIREAATTTVAPGGFGKTSLLLHDAICMVAKGLHVWFVSGEDPKDEIDRRIAAHCKHHNIDLSKLPGRLYVDDRTMFSLFIARSPRPASVQFDDQSLAQFAAAIVADKIDVVILDPFVSFHSVPENDNGAIDAVVKRLASIAHINKCCVEISHHVRKPFQGQASITVDDARGGGAIINAVRSGRVINRMSQHEAETAGIADDKRASYLRIDKGKRNMAPPEAASWFRIVGVIIGNDDNVQAIEPWVFPRAEQPTADDLLWLKATVKNKRYGADPRQTDWLGIAVAEHFGRDRDDKKDLAWIKGTISNWIKDKVIRRVNRLNEQKKERGFYEVVETDSAPITPAPPDLLEPEDYE